MEDETIKKMWDIDGKIQVGKIVSKEERDFYNKYYKDMLKEMYENHRHWKYFAVEELV